MTVKSSFKSKNKEWVVYDNSICFKRLHELFVLYASIDQWRTFLKIILHASVSPEPTLYRNSPCDHIFRSGQWIKLLHCAHYLYKHSEISPPETVKIKHLLLPKTILSGETLESKIQYLPKTLNGEEIRDPRLVLNLFFDKRSLKKWIKLWNLWREEGLSDYNGLDEEDIEGALEDYDLLCKLQDACYLLYIRSGYIPK